MNRMLILTSTFSVRAMAADSFNPDQPTSKTLVGVGPFCAPTPLRQVVEADLSTSKELLDVKTSLS